MIEIPRVVDSRGILSVIDGNGLLPFEPKRFFYIYGVPEGAQRGCHALKHDEELIVPLTGAFTILVDDGESKTEFRLDRPDQGLYLPPLVWHVLHSFTPRSLCGVLAGAPFGDSGARRTGFLGEREKHSWVKTNGIPG